jgi:hypothetical protein
MAMEKTVYSLDDKVDYYLHKISIAPTLTLDAKVLYETDVLNEESYLIDQVMLEKGLIKLEKGSRVITGKGLEISNFGGWSLYQKLLRKENQQNFLTTDPTYKRISKEVDNLQKRVKELEEQLNEKNQKETFSNRLVSNLIQQNKINKIACFVIGAITGAVVTYLGWLFLI